MNATHVVLVFLLVLVLVASATMDFRGTPQIEDLMRRLGFRPKFEHTLGLIKVVGALGLLIGLAVGWIGFLAALGLVIYFALGVQAHRRIEDPMKETIPAIGLLGVSALVLVTGLLA
jgi:uncharacterized membrane protein YphA (DoxX/SURF4 family)